VPSAPDFLDRLESSVLAPYPGAFRSGRGLETLEAVACFAVLPILRDQPRDESVGIAIRRLAVGGWAKL